MNTPSEWATNKAREIHFALSDTCGVRDRMNIIALALDDALRKAGEGL